MAQVNVTISGKVYRMACDDGQEDHLTGLAAELNRTVENLRQNFGEIGDQRLTVMAAITMADELSEAHERIDELSGEVARLRDAATADSRRSQEVDESLADAIETAAGQIEAIARKIGGLET